jgi:membrane carboxypeptidase/penicillin-binding protein
MGKTGTTNNYRDALFVGSTFGPSGITVAVRIGFDDNRSLGVRETGALAALPVFRELILKVYQEKLVGAAPRFPAKMEESINAYLRGEFPQKDVAGFMNPLGAPILADEAKENCSAKLGSRPTNRCELPSNPKYPIYPSKNQSGRSIFVNE